jgi:cation transport ATPase
LPLYNKGVKTLLCPYCLEWDDHENNYCGHCGRYLRENFDRTSIAENNVITFVSGTDKTKIVGNDDSTFVKGSNATTDTLSVPSIFSTIPDNNPSQLESTKVSELEQSRLENRAKIWEAIGVGVLRFFETVILFATGIAIIFETAFAHLAIEQGLTWSSLFTSGWQLLLSGTLDSSNHNTLNNFELSAIIFTIGYAIALYAIYGTTSGERGYETLQAFMAVSFGVEAVAAFFVFLLSTGGLAWEMLGGVFIATVFILTLGLVVHLAVNKFGLNFKKW